MKRINIQLFFMVLVVTATAQQLPVYKYGPGMRFYYPVDDYRADRKDEVPGYSRILGFITNNGPFTKVTYDQLSGKAFQLDSAAEVNDFNRIEKHKALVFYLTSLENPDFSMSYSFPKDAALVSRMEDSLHQKQSLTLENAVFLDDVRDADSILKGRALYTKFPVRLADSSQLKYQRVVVTRVTAGVWYAPIRVYFKPTDGAEQFVDVVTTGTNVLPAYFDHYLFSDRFDVADPRHSLSAPGTDEQWKLICQSRVVSGMTREQVISALGKPDKKETEDDAGKPGGKYIYEKVEVHFTGNAVDKVKDTR
jgi:hypothetical protein